jgi:hypothetical protein
MTGFWGLKLLCYRQKNGVPLQKNVAHKTINLMGDTMLPLQTLVQFT